MAAAGGGAAGGAAAWPWIAALGGSLIGGLGSMMGGQASGSASDTSRTATRRQIELGKNQAVINSQMMSPFVGAGMGAMQELYGYSPVQGSTGNYGSGGYESGGGSGENAFTVPELYTGSKWKSPTLIGGTTYAKTGQGFDPTGGSDKYKSQLEALSPQLQYQGYNPDQYIPQLQQYGQNFKFNENDPAYQYQKQVAERDINRQTAARGLYGSRAAINQLDESGRAITASEYDKQYNRGYQNLMDLYGMSGQEDQRSYGKAVDQYGRQVSSITDLYNMALQQGNVGYNALLDAVKIGTGAGTASGSLGNQATGQLQSAYNNMSQNAFMGAQGQANAIGGVAGSAMGGLNNYMLYSMLQGRNQPAAQTQ